MKKWAWVVLGLALAAVVAGGIVLRDTSSASAGPTVVKDKAAKYAETGYVELEELNDGIFSGLRGLGEYKDKLTGDSYIWDIKGGFIRRYSSDSGYAKRGKGARISESKALKIAKKWASRGYDGASTDNMTVTCTRKDEGDEGFGEWIVEFRSYAGEIPTFDHFLVVLDAVTGEVLFTEQECGALTENLDPAVSRERAIATAASTLCVPEACCVDAHLEVVRTLDAEQVLVWVVSVKTGDDEFGGSGTVIVDAHKGSVMDSGKSW